MTDNFTKYRNPPDMDLEPAEETPFILIDEILLTNIINEINSCTEKYYNYHFRSDTKEFTKCCTEEEKNVLKKCIQIMQVDTDYNPKAMYAGLVQFYYSTIVLEYYVSAENYYRCFDTINQKYPGAVKVRDAITVSNEPWASKVRQLINFSSTKGKNIKGGKRRYINKRRNKTNKKKRHSRKSRKHSRKHSRK